MKKIIAIILAALMLTTVLASCGTDKNDGKETTTPTTTAKPADTTKPSETTKPVDTTKPGETTTTPDTTVNPGNDASLEDLFEKIYEICPLNAALATVDVNLTEADRVKYYTGLDSAANIEECLVSEAMISVTAYSTFIMRVKDGTDIDEIKEDILNGVDLRRWICVGADRVVVGNSGNLIFMAMTVDSMVSGADLYAAFCQAAGGVAGEMLERSSN